MDVSDATPADAGAVAEIYNHYVAHTVVTFAEQPVDAAEMAALISEASSHALPFLVAKAQGEVVGFSYASKWKGRCAYRFSAETTVYLAHAHIGRGVGSRLYSEVIARLRTAGLHAAIGGIALPNDASIGLHRKLGFAEAGTFREVGYKFGRWIDVAYWELLL
jgi:L-amino acid N-acyltransferase YncA